MEKLELVDSVTFFSLVKKEPYGRASTVGGFGIHQFIIKPPTVVKRTIFQSLIVSLLLWAVLLFVILTQPSHFWYSSIYYYIFTKTSHY